MKIPIQNIYYLLCYAWDKLAEKEVVNVDAADTVSLADLFAKVLINGTNHLLKRGFDRGYIFYHEWTGRLRGRICFQEGIRKNALKTGRLPCDFDELSYNVLHNQILKATIRRLIRTEGLAAESSERLVKICRLFSDIQDIELTNRVFGQVQLHRNNQFYDFLLKVCELIYRNLLVFEKSGTSKFMDFVQDDRQMRTLFEEFVRNFYKIERRDCSVEREDIKWRWVPDDQVAKEFLPEMQTDISLSSATRRMIIDCKFTAGLHQNRFKKLTLHSKHLYQIFAYYNNLLEGKLNETCEMMLLYPTVDKSLSVTYTDRGHKISIRTINLNQHWQNIRNDLLDLVA